MRTITENTTITLGAVIVLIGGIFFISTMHADLGNMKAQVATNKVLLRESFERSQDFEKKVLVELAEIKVLLKRRDL